MERPIVYPNQLGADTDVLRIAKAAMVGMGWLFEAVLGTSTVVDGLACTPGTGLNVSVAAGQIYFQEATDATAYGSLGTDANLIVKQGLTLATALAVPAPTTAGQSINYLVEAQYQDVDTTSIPLAYYNSANPLIPFTGVGGNGVAQNTVRRGVCALQVKAGTAAATGSQTTPAADAGWVGLWVVTVAYGAASIVSGNIAQLATAPFINPKLPAVAAEIQSGGSVYAVDTSGTANAIVASLTPAPAALTAGLTVHIKAANTSGGTGAVTVNLNGLGAVALQSMGAAMRPGQIVAGRIYTLVYDGTEFQFQGSPGPISGSNTNGRWRIDSDGFIQQWMDYTTAVGTEADVTLNYPIPFTSACVWAGCIVNNSGDSPTGDTQIQLVGLPGLSSAVFRVQDQQSTDPDAAGGFLAKVEGF